MNKKYDFKYLVIGSSPAGYAVAFNLAKAKKKVGIVESNLIGGADDNNYNIPSSIAFDFAHNYHRISNYPELSNQDFTFNFPTTTARSFGAIMKISENRKKALEESGAIILRGNTHFLDKHTVAVGDKKITAEFFILATGTQTNTSSISNAGNINFLTPETIFKIHRLPKVITVVGGGPTGCEIAEYFAELGSKVLLLEAKERILPNEDKDTSETITKYFTEQLGIAILTNCNVVSIEKDEHSKYIIFRHQDSEKLIRTNNIVLATGSEPFLDYGLENAEVKYKKSGIPTNKLFQTSSKHIFAIGNCVNSSCSTSRAHQEGITLASNLLSKNKNTADYHGIVRTINTSPKVAVVGFTENELIKRKRSYKKAVVNLAETSIGKICNLKYSFVKILINRNGQILGACAVAPQAELLLSEISLAIRHNLTVLELASTPYTTNSYSEAIHLAAKNLLNKKTTNKKH